MSRALTVALPLLLASALAAQHQSNAPATSDDIWVELNKTAAHSASRVEGGNFDIVVHDRDHLER